MPSVEAEVEVLKAQVKELMEWKVSHEREHKEDARAIEQRLHSHGNKINEAMLFKQDAIADMARINAKLAADLARFGVVDTAINSLKMATEKSRWTVGAIVAALLWALHTAWDAFMTYYAGGKR